MKQNYRYKGPVFNGDVIYTSIDEYVHAYTPSQALTILQRRLRGRHGLLLWLKEDYLRAVEA